MILSERLKELRTSHELTQKQVAKVLNIDRSAYSYYETGKSQPTISTLIKLAKIFKISIDDLLLYTPQPQEQSGGKTKMFAFLSEQEQILVMYYRCLSEEQAEELMLKLKSHT